MGRHREFNTDGALDAVVRIFWQKGYEGTSYDDLCQATGVARPGLYSAFGNKEALFLHALDRYDAQFMSFMPDSLEAPSSYQVVERMLRGTADIITRFAEQPGCLGVNGAIACSVNGEPVRQELVRRRAAAEMALLTRLRRAKAEHDLPEGADCETLASFIIAITTGLAVKAKSGASQEVLQAIVEYVLETWPARP